MAERTLFLVPARGGSRRIERKNLAFVAGIPLVGWAIRTARIASDQLDGPFGNNLVLCSTDDDAIAEAAAAWGGTVLRRPATLTTDHASSVEVALHALAASSSDGAPFGTLVLIQPSSPLLEPADVVAAVRRHRATGRGVTTVVASHPTRWHLPMDDETLGVAVDDAPPHKEVLLAGACYVVAAQQLRGSGRFVTPGETLGLELPLERAVDVDQPHQLAEAEAMLAARTVRPIRLGDRAIGTGPVFVIAEAGVNHDGDIDVAHRLIDAAADAGADAVKFQTFDPDALAAADAPDRAVPARSGRRGLDQRAMLRTLALPVDAWAALQQHAQ